MTFKNNLENFAGIACKILYPIPITTFKGKGLTVSICTLSSIDLLKKISLLDIMDHILIAGRLLSENKGIDQMIEFSICHPALKYLILCGQDTKGHFPGDALINLINNGADANGKIIGTKAHYPFLTSSKMNIKQFRKQITVIDLRNCLDVDNICSVAHNFIF